MSQLFKNAARSALMASLAAIDTSLTVNIIYADLFPAANTGTDPVPTVGKDWFKIVVEDSSHNYEIIYARTRTLGSATMSNLLRGQEGTTALSFAAGSIVELRLTALDLQNAIDLAAQATTPGKNVLWAATVDAQVQALGSGLQKQIATSFTTTGTSTAYLLTPTPAIAAYVANLSFDVTFDEVCGNDPTLQISGVATPPNLVKQLINGSYANIKAGDIPANHRSRVTMLSPTQALVEKLPPKFSAAGSDIASAATLDLTGRDGNIVDISGIVETTGITLESGGRVLTIALAAWPINVAGILVYTCAAGDLIEWNKDLAGTLRAVVWKKGQAPTFVDSPFGLTAVPNGSNGLLITLKKGGWFFRNPTLATGAFEYVKTDTDLTLTISSGSTLGTTNAVQSDVLARVVNDAGTLRLTAENMAGGMDASETGVISTTAEGGAGAADSSTVIYSGTAVTSKSYRVAGIVRSTQATAGTWATAPSLVQGAGGQAVFLSRSSVRVHTWNGYASTNTTIGRFTTVVTNQGSDITYADSATLGASFTINRPGTYGMSFTTDFSSVQAFGISLNGTALSVNINAIAPEERLCLAAISLASAPLTVATTVWLNAGDVIRPHASGSGASTTSAANQFTITRVS